MSFGRHPAHFPMVCLRTIDEGLRNKGGATALESVFPSWLTVYLLRYLLAAAMD